MKEPGLKIILNKDVEIIFIFHSRTIPKILEMKQILGCFKCHKCYFSVFYTQYETVTELKLVKLCLNDKKNLLAIPCHSVWIHY